MGLSDDLVKIVTIESTGALVVSPALRWFRCGKCGHAARHGEFRVSRNFQIPGSRIVTCPGCNTDLKESL